MLSLGETQELMKGLSDWSLEGMSMIKMISFGDFRQALEFANKVGEIAIELNHYPDIIISYNIVKLTLSSPSENAITEKDFEVAKKIDKL